MNDKNRKIVIIGNGIAGITCARNIRKNDSKTEILVISGESKYFFSRTALMYIYMGHMKYEHTKPYEDWFWEKNNISLKKAWVELINFKKKEVLLDSSEKIEYDILVLATGSKPNKFDWPGQDFKGVQGLYSKQDLEEMERNTQDINHAVVVGGGLIGIEMAEMLVSRKISVTFLVREKNFWDNVLPQDEAKLIGKHILEHHIDLRLETELKEILADENGTVNSIITNKGEKISCQFVGLAVGVSPNVNFLWDSGLEINRGVLVDHYFQTNQPDVYAIGDCAEFKQAPSKDRKNIEQVWYTGRMHGETLANNLVSNPVAYQPGIWFNSAKFLDIEYQTYGIVPNQSIDELDSFYWEHQSGKNCIRLVYDKSSGKLVGVNSLGWRLRHEFFDVAIQKCWKLEEVLRQLPKADFNAEFFKKHYHQVLEKFEAETGQKIVVSKPSFLKRLIGSRS